MHQIRVYVDTSVFGGTQDDEFREASNAFFEQVWQGHYLVLVSRVTIGEIDLAPQQVQQVLLSLPDSARELHEISQEAVALARAYIDGKALPKRCFEDALHVAMASTLNADVILSWNFKHIVNFNRIRLFNSVNLANAYRPIDIRSPLEVIQTDDDEDQSV